MTSLFSSKRFVTLVLICALFSIPSKAGWNPDSRESPQSYQPSSIRMIDVNNIVMSVQNDGMFADAEYANGGMFLDPDPPFESADFMNRLLFTAGLVLSAEMRGSTRVMASYYFPDAVPGAVDAAGLPYGQDNPAFRVYKIGSADSLNHGPDWDEWPVSQGAPADDGRPVLLGDQTLFCSFTDAGTVPDGFPESDTEPLGAEVHLTVWGWESVDDMVFLRWKITNKSGQIWKNAYAGLAGDPDLGGGSGDLIGSDSLLSLVYCYHWTNYESHFGPRPPAVGFQFVQTPMIPSPGDTARGWRSLTPGFRNSPALSPIVMKHHSDGPFPSLTSMDAQGVYDRLRGLDEDGNRMIDPFTGLRTDWGFSGDPVAGTGWLDPNPKDRRFLISSGPFDLAPGETQTVAIAALAGRGGDHLDSVTRLKRTGLAARALYRASAALVAGEVIADPRTPSFDMPVWLCNPDGSIRDLSFSVRTDPDQLNVIGAEAAGRASGLTVRTVSEGADRVRVAVQGEIPRGAGDIVHLTLGWGPSPAGRSVTVELENASASALIETIPGSVTLNRSAVPVRLLAPQDGTVLQSPLLEFKWTRSADSDGDSLIYRFYWGGADAHSFSTVDTFYHMTGFGRFQGGESVRWTVTVSDGIHEIASPDTFEFRVPPEEQWGRTFHLGKFTAAPEEHSIYNVCVDGERLFASSGIYYTSPLVSAYDLSRDPAAPCFLGSFVFPDSLSSVSLSGLAAREGFLYGYAKNARSGTYCLTVIDFRNPSAPVLRLSGGLDEGKEPDEIAFWGKRLVLMSKYWDNTFWVFDLTNPGRPLKIGVFSMPDMPIGSVLFADSDLYYRYRRAGGNSSNIDEIEIGRVRSDWTVEVLGRLGLDFGNADSKSRLAAENGLLHWTETFDDGLQYPSGFSQADRLNVADVRDPAHPVLRGTTLAGFRWDAVTCRDGMLVTEGEIFDVRDPDHPVPAGYSRHLGCDLAVRWPMLYGWASGHSNTVRVVQCGLSATPAGYPSGKTSPRTGRAFPNPFNGTVSVYYGLDSGAKVSVEIFNVLGQAVRRETLGDRTSGSHLYRWDGLMDEGTPAAAGVYILKITAGKQAAGVKILKLN